MRRPYLWGALVLSAGILVGEGLNTGPALILPLSAVWIAALAFALIERRDVPDWSLAAGIFLVGMAIAARAVSLAPYAPGPPAPYSFISRKGQPFEVRVSSAPPLFEGGRVKLRGVVVSHPETTGPPGASQDTQDVRGATGARVAPGTRVTPGARITRSDRVTPGAKATLRVSEAQVLGETGAWQLIGKRVILDVRKQIAPFPGAPGMYLRYGDEVSLEGFLRPPGGPRNPGDPDMRKAFARKGIVANVYVGRWDEFLIIRRNRANPIMGLAATIRGMLLRINHLTLPACEAQVMDGILLGIKPKDPKTRKIIEDAGALHLFAVSGLNVAIIGGIIWTILEALSLKGWANWVVTSLFVCLYVLSVGAGASCVRAGIMFLAARMRLARRSEADWDTLNGLGVAALVLLIWDPGNLFDPGFLLSFAATLGVVGLSPRIRSLLGPISERFGPPGDHLSSAISISMGAQLAVWPLVVHFFGNMTWWATVSNLVLVPLAGIATTLGFTAAGVGLISLPVAKALNASNLLVIRLLVRSAELWSKAPPLPGPPPVLPHWFMWLYYGGVISISCLAGTEAAALFWTRLRASVIRLRVRFRGGFRGRGPRKPLSRAAIALGLASIVILAWLLTGSRAPERHKAKITFLSCGQGDCALAITPGGYTILIDGGGQPDFDVGRGIVIPYLRKAGTRRIDIMLLSHPHEDHVAGLVPVVEEYEVGLVLDPGQPETSGAYEEFLDAVKRRGITLRRVRRGAQMDLPDGTLIKVLHPPETLLIGTGSEANDNSIVAKLTLGGVDFLFTGDIEAAGQTTLLGSGADLSSDVLKVPHHGAKGLMPELLGETRPKAAMVSVGINPFGHPDADTLRTLERAGVRTFRTDKVGGVVVNVK